MSKRNRTNGGGNSVATFERIAAIGRRDRAAGLQATQAVKMDASTGTRRAQAQ